MTIPALDPLDFNNELRGNILPFWMDHSLDRANGGFYGALSNDLRITTKSPAPPSCAHAFCGLSRPLTAYMVKWNIYKRLATLTIRC